MCIYVEGRTKLTYIHRYYFSDSVFRPLFSLYLKNKKRFPQKVFEVKPKMMAPKKTQRGSAFSHQEVEFFLSLVEEFVPIGNEEWKIVEKRHAQTWGETHHSYLSLQRKFQALKSRSIPTGDPNCHNEVVRAKKVYKEIVDKSECLDVEGGKEEMYVEELLDKVMLEEEVVPEVLPPVAIKCHVSYQPLTLPAVLIPTSVPNNVATP